MGKINCKNQPKLINYILKEFNITKNNIKYKIKIILERKNVLERIKINISFIISNKFNLYELYLDQNSEIGMSEKCDILYQKISKEIKNKNFEIIHQTNDTKYIFLKLDINKESKLLKLISSVSVGEIHSNQLSKTNHYLESEYVNINKNEKNNKINNIFTNHTVNINNENDNINNNYHFDDNNNIINDNKIDTDYYDQENSDGNHIVLKTNSKIWCMIKLTQIIHIKNIERLNLVALGLSSNKIIIINLDTMKIHQEMNTKSTVYSLAQFKDDSKYLICSLSNGQMIIYILKDYKYKEYQILEKPKEMQRGEINKVITLSDGNIATAERGALSIWKAKTAKGNKKFEFFKEIITHNDTCQLLEVNPQVFACAIYNSKLIQVYKNDGNNFPLLGQIDNARSHGSNSNGMVKINDNIFCSGGEHGFIYVVSVEPVQVIQKMNLDLEENWHYVLFLHKSIDEFIFTSIGDEIIQFKIIKDEEGNYIRLEQFNIIEDGSYNSAIITTEDGKIFYKRKIENYNENTYLFLTKYKQLND